ncbi:MAG: hypothetical protein HY823_03900 [Acidobacteria bacterium]|nr:hypothetical protein [Acidobacteriota bacterium]
MKTLKLSAAALAAATLGAQSASTDTERRVQIFGEFSRPKQVTIAQIPVGSGSAEVKDQAAAQTGIGIRFMGEIPGTSGWFYGFGGKFPTSSRLGLNQTVPGTSTTINATQVTVQYSFWEIGGAYLWELGGGFSLGAHLDARSETVDASGSLTVSSGGGSGTVSQRTSFLRPWIRLSADVAFGGSGFAPFLGADVAYAPIKASQTNVVSPVMWDDRTLKFMAPQFTASFYLGLRF